MFEKPPKEIIKEMQQTLNLIQRPKDTPPPLYTSTSNQGVLLREIDYFCQKLTTQKKTRLKSPQNVETNLFQADSQLIQQQEPQTPEQRKVIDQIDQKDQKDQEQPMKTQLNIGAPKQQKLVIKKLQFVEENQNWIPIRVEKRLQQQNLLKVNLNLCLFWSEEDLQSLKYSQINILGCLEQMKKMECFCTSIRDLQNIDFWKFDIHNIELLKQLRTYSILVSMKEIGDLRELYIRLNEIKKELTNEGIYERKRNMLGIELMRIQKKIIIGFLRLQCKYKSIINKNIIDAQIIRKCQIKKIVLKQLLEYKIKQKNKREFYNLLVEHMRIYKLHQCLHQWKQIKKQQQNNINTALLKIYQHQYFKQWYETTRQQNYQQQQQHYDQQQIIDIYELSYRIKRCNLNNFELSQKYRICFNFKEKVFLKWKLSYNQLLKYKSIIKYMELRKMKLIMHTLKQKDQSQNQFYKNSLMHKSFKILQKHRHNKKHYSSLEKQRQLIDDMVIQVYENNLLKKVVRNWFSLVKEDDDQMNMNQIEELYRKKRQQDQEIEGIRSQIMKRWKLKQILRSWLQITRLSKKSIENLKECEKVTRKEVVSKLISLSYKLSLDTQYKLLEYIEQL